MRREMGEAKRGPHESIRRGIEKRRSSSGRRMGIQSGRRRGPEIGRRMANAMREGRGTEIGRRMANAMREGRVTEKARRIGRTRGRRKWSKRRQ